MIYRYGTIDGKMDPKIKRAWLRDLRTHRQASGLLCRADNKGHCCLGRLAIVLGYQFKKNGIDARQLADPNGNLIRVDGQPQISVLPDALLDKAGLDRAAQSVLVRINDKSHGFRKVVAWIKENL